MKREVAGVCIQVLCLSTSEGRETKAFWTSTALTHPRMEMGAHHNGFLYSSSLPQLKDTTAFGK